MRPLLHGVSLFAFLSDRVCKYLARITYQMVCQVALLPPSCEPKPLLYVGLLDYVLSLQINQKQMPALCFEYHRLNGSYVTIHHKCTNFVPKNRQTKFVERFLLCKQAIPLLHSPMTSHDSLSHRSTYSISVARVTAV